MAESGSDLRFGLLEEGRPHPPVAAAVAAVALVGGAQRRCNRKPPWLHAIRLYCIITATAMLAVFAAEVFPRCKGKQDVLLCVVALAGAVFTGPILGFVLTTFVDDADDHEAARIASPYTRCEENVGRSVILAVALLGLYAIYLAAVSCGEDVDGFLLAAYYGVLGVGMIVGHSVSWIMGCFQRRD
uniref:Uncharacterized protein n=1 Tax=Oryza punctata TaxID=4537 RepID=A0A0E0JLA4_ORYPU